MKIAKFQKYIVSFQVKTPVHIGTGEVYSPYKDYFITKENGKTYCCFLDSEKLDQAFLKNQGAIDEFTSHILYKMDLSVTRSDFNIYDFIKNKLYENPLEFVSKKLRGIGLSTNDRKEIWATIKTEGNPYIPGSSLKGSFKTALLYKLLHSDSTQKAEVKNHLLLKNEKSISKLLEQFQKIRVTDTIKMQKADMGIYSTYRYHILKNKETIPNVMEMIIPGSKGFFELDLPENLKLNTLIDALNIHAYNAMTTEEYIIKDYDGESDIKGALLDFYDEYLALIPDQGNDQNKAYIRIGKGKSIYDNTILDLYEEDQNDFKKIRRNFKLGVKKLDELFPLTRSVTESSHLPLGWMELEFTKHSI